MGTERWEGSGVALGLFAIMILLAAGLMVERSKLSLIPLVLAIIFGAIGIMGQRPQDTSGGEQ